ncbi:hypothetical protein ASPWEDRAFT_30041 [Aspergillus wentii DTO 134E9]|uniref:Uncharacterized protein n=1 Tax=Aspergillus wentii DTO 134E9 TaxID=1073089 RepID=A0A1L9RDD0_ASPWE|nr:uncharacterized protein ASPWEDRAFT_30041 [Aspergillus wentii DTO 134E9]KAI9933187.1 hypothetical protein MW887_007658 [Aspergillus wentii]OJJ32914.1 hypothetical protein ASPWEDRAFT_30041 [Aspergillus wentii DTO 134E9]
MPSHGGLEIFRLLIKAGADISMRDDMGITPLHQAARAGDCPILDMLMQHGADVNSQTKNGRTPLIEAIAVDSDRKPHLLVTTMLLERGADVGLTSSDGRTVLHEMASMPQKRLNELDINVVSLLLDNGADPTARDHNGQLASDLAARESNTKMVQVLERWGME